jgi:hypothetical protein
LPPPSTVVKAGAVYGTVMVLSWTIAAGLVMSTTAMPLPPIDSSA